MAEAYEILGSPDKKEVYDAMFRPAQKVQIPTARSVYNKHPQTRNYTDLDIDYKDFEHFQKSAR